MIAPACATMKILHTLAIASLLSFFALPADAGNNNNNKKAIEQAKKLKAQKEKERVERKKVNEEIKDYMATRDKNKNGALSKEEFMLGESDAAKAESTFNTYDKNRDRALHKREIQAMLGL
jgi:hypothetical protein